MIKNKKAQVSIEVIIIIVFIIVFLYVFNDLAEDNVRTIEINKIKEQQHDIAYSLNEYLKLQESVIGDAGEYYNIVQYTSYYNIPIIEIPSQKVGCSINVSPTKIMVSTMYKNNSLINTDFNTNISNADYNLSSPYKFSCGQEIVCEKTDNRLIRCS